MSEANNQEIKEFLTELSGFATTAEGVLQVIEKNMEGEKDKFAIFSQQMFTIRGTAQQLEFPEIAKIAGLGEEIAVKAKDATSRGQIRKCVGSLWDALTTVKYLLENDAKETSEEREILVQRLENTLKVLGGARPTMTEEEIQKMLMGDG